MKRRYTRNSGDFILFNDPALDYEDGQDRLLAYGAYLHAGLDESQLKIVSGETPARFTVQAPKYEVVNAVQDMTEWQGIVHLVRSCLKRVTGRRVYDGEGNAHDLVLPVDEIQSYSDRQPPMISEKWMRESGLSVDDMRYIAAAAMRLNRGELPFLQRSDTPGGGSG